MPRLAYLDLFSGIGGWALGAYMAGVTVDCHFASEINPHAKVLYKSRFPDSVQLGDITKIDPAKLLAYCGDTEWVVSASFPCQRVSAAGLRTGIREADKVSSGLWFEAARVVKVLRPRVFLIENVGDLALRGLDAVIGTLEELGYDAEWRIISAFDMGAPHLRERLWVMAWPRGEWRDGHCGPLSFKAQRSRHPCGRSSMELAEVGYRDRFHIGKARDRGVFGDGGLPLGSKMPRGGCLDGGDVFGIPAYIAGLHVEEVGLGKPVADSCCASRPGGVGSSAGVVLKNGGLQAGQIGGLGAEHGGLAQGVVQDGAEILDDSLLHFGGGTDPLHGGCVRQGRGAEVGGISSVAPKQPGSLPRSLPGEGGSVGKKVLEDSDGVVGRNGVTGGAGLSGNAVPAFIRESGATGLAGSGDGYPSMANPDTVGWKCARCGDVQEESQPGGGNLGRSQPHILEGCWDVKPGFFSVVDGVPFWVGCDGQPVAFPVIAKAVTPADVRHQLAGYGNAVLPAITWALWRRAGGIYPKLLEEM